MKTTARILNALLVIAGIAASGLAAAQMVLKLGYSLPATSHYGAGAIAFAAEIAKKSGGRYKIEQYPANALGGEREMTEAVQLGTLDLVITSTGPIGNFVPETLITDIPFLFRDYDHAHRVLDGPIGQEILDKCTPKGLLCLAWSENGFRHLTNNKRAVNTPDDMKGLKVRTMENQVHMMAFRTLGAAPTPMAFPELFGALQQGTVDGEENPIPVITSARFAQVQKYLSLTGHVYSPALVIMPATVWNRLSDADKKMFKQAALVSAAATRQKVAEVETTGIKELQSQGMQVVTNIDKAKFQAALAPAYAEYAKKFGQANIDRIRNYK
jgi:tripartite ATP-independent transporter DctP family solute receptor